MKRDSEESSAWREDPWDAQDAWLSSEFEALPHDRRPDSRTVLIALLVVMTVVLSVPCTTILPLSAATCTPFPKESPYTNRFDPLTKALTLPLKRYRSS
ncbi:MAG: hypothetical protein RLZZ534_88, partial [Actinomycetota bacterium]